MNHIKQLTFLQLRQILNQANLHINNHPLLTKLLWLVLIFTTLLYSGGYTYLLSKVLDGPFILSLYYALTSFILLFSTIYFVHDLFIVSHDQTILSPLPIKKTTIIQSRFFAIYILNTALYMLIMIPVYAILLYNKEQIMTSFILSPLLPILPMSIGLILGYVIEYIASKFKHRQFLTILFTMLFIIFIFTFTNSLNENIELSTFSNMLLEMFKHLYYPTVLFYDIITDFNLLSLTILLVLNGLGYLCFIKIASKDLNQNTKQSYAIKKTHTTYSLARLEINRYFHSVGYVTNTAIGYVLLAIGLFSINKVPHSLLPFAYLFLVGMATTTHVSFSLENQYFWIKKTLPIPFLNLAKAKLMVTYILSIPTFIISSLVYITFYKFQFEPLLLCLLGTILFPILGLTINLFSFNFYNTNDTIVVKQSFSSLLMLSSITILSGIPLYLSFKYTNILLPTSIIYGILILICLYLIIKKGPLQYAKMPGSDH